MSQMANRTGSSVLGGIAPRPVLPVAQSYEEEDYDDAYLNKRAEATVSDVADLPLFSPVTEFKHIATSADLLARCRQYLSRSDVETIQRAFRYADDAHLGQFRKSGEAYITHPLAVASILADWHLDATTICAGLMHDVLEDTGIAKIEMAERFGIEVTELVDGVSKLDKLRFSSNEVAQAESFRKMLLAMSRDVRVILVKLADRLHNLRTLGVMRPEKRHRIGKETVEIYVPIAHRLGLNQVFRELQELSFLNMYPRRYQVLKDNVLNSRGNRRTVLERILRETREILPKHRIVAQVQGRDKTIYGIYNRMKDSHQSFSEALDVYGFRIIVRTREECYLTLCALHQLYKPVHHRFKDFIAIPKANGYQSLHTTVIGPNGTAIEYQIRTEQMHRIDEMGILSHWLYNDGLDTTELQNMVAAWLQSLMEIQRTSKDSNEFLENIKIDLFPDRVYIFTPKSKIISLPQGSCAVDFAYQVHTDVGNKTVGCKINGEIDCLSKVLENGDMVEILTSPDAQPDPHWLTFVRSGKARAEVRQYLRSRSAEETVSIGRRAMEKAAQEAHFDLDCVSDDVWNKLLKETDTKDRNAVLAAIGLGKQFANALVARLIAFTRDESNCRQQTRVKILGTEGVSVQLASCCHPIPGDSICGYMRKGQGMTIHRKDCHLVARGRQTEPERWTSIGWKDEQNQQALFTVPVDLIVTQERAALASVATELARYGSSIIGLAVEDGSRSDESTTLHLTIQIRNRAHLKEVLGNLSHLPTVKSVYRLLDGDRKRDYSA